MAFLGFLADLERLREPLDLDSSVYSTVGAHLGPGWLPYRDVFDHKQPLVYAVYWVIDVTAPRDASGVRVAAAVVAIVAALLLLGMRRQVGRRRAFAMSAVLAVLAGSSAVEGGDLNTEHLLVLTTGVAMILPLTRWRSAWVWLPVVSGALLGLAALTKVVGLFVAPAALLPLLAGRAARSHSVPRTLALFAAGAAAPAVALLAFYAAADGLGALWYDNVVYNLAYVGGSGSKSLGWWFAVPHPLRWLVLGALLAGIVRLLASKGRDVLTISVMLWLAGALLGAKWGRRDFPHYFAPVLTPAVVLVCLPLLAADFSRLRQRLVSMALVAVSIGPLLLPMAAEFRLPVDVYSSPTAVGDLLAGRGRAGDRLFVAGSHTWVYATSGIRPATRYIYDLPRGTIKDFDSTIERELSSRPPRFVVIADGAFVPAYLEQLRVQRYRLTDRVENFDIYELSPAAGSPEESRSPAEMQS